MNYLILRGMNEMKKTKEIKENIIEETLKFTSREDAEEFRSIARGRKFCKKAKDFKIYVCKKLKEVTIKNHAIFL